MPTTYNNPVYPYRRPPELDRESVRHCPVVIVGAGPTGLAMAIDLAQQGIASVVLDDNNTVSVGSRAICFAKRTLEILDRLGCAQPMVDKGVTWQRGRVFFQEREVYDFDLLPEEGHRMPAFINLQQYYFEEYLVDRADALSDLIDLRWKHKVTEVASHPERSEVTVSTEDGGYRLACDYLLVADGANSKIRDMLGLESRGQVFQDRFLIADVIMKADFPTERWFWFDPPFHPNQSVLLHRQPDNVWRIDFQLGWDADPEEEKKEENIRPRVQAMLGEDVEFELEWASVYTFRCRKMDDYIHNRVFFMGDAAHQVSPFGARGANGAIQSTENLAWKLARVLKGQAPAALLATYNDERQHGAAENILNSTRATDFITPKSRVSRLFRDSVLELAEHYPFARRLVNSGRLSMPCHYDDSPLNGPETEGLPLVLRPGSPAKDAPIGLAGRRAWLLNQLGDRFTLLLDGRVDSARAEALRTELEPLLARQADLDLLVVGPAPHALTELPRSRQIEDVETLVGERYGLTGGVAYLFRPDQHVSARWRQVSAAEVEAAIDHALGRHLDAEEVRHATA
ncbi:FAD-dependent oxidoreductase [Halomonas sp. MCCC 1A17488]|uniref:FAD-dependent oxidoreductase n=1 Tax=unclassified Halomonas TaxID=2609666 RepID=UPI0018D25C2F|nr:MULTISPECIES: FAD-dependent oxidoreductase [unclassified Halomonas]MCE8017157.1 FAD-dependent oxidoreductase [Halomonas sp. MCCC 1A17488]MCG3240490.1 FAD-dependent oxidoreductase [Halomonas sp. MCCC 1A17488]QPP49652.1 FAD-dependent oxidoreductase [Halomonas sp. SS10-MC5]